MSLLIVYIGSVEAGMERRDVDDDQDAIVHVLSDYCCNLGHEARWVQGDRSHEKDRSLLRKRYP